MPGYVYLMSDRYRGGIYTGVAADVIRRVGQHRANEGSAFVRKHGFRRLVYLEHFERIEDAITREKRIKKWRRAWKIALIETMNPDWRDLWETLNM